MGVQEIKTWLPGKGMELSARLPEPRLTLVYRLEPAISEPLVIGDLSTGHRRIIRLDGGTVTGPEINGKLLAGVNADWQVVCRTASPCSTFATRSRPTAATWSTCNHEACALAAAATTRPPRLHPNRDRILRSRLDEQSVFISVGGIRQGKVIWEIYLVS